MGTEITIYVEQDLDLDRAMELIDEFVHDRDWCGCLQGKVDPAAAHGGVWSARRLLEPMIVFSKHHIDKEK